MQPPVSTIHAGTETQRFGCMSRPRSLMELKTLIFTSFRSLTVIFTAFDSTPCSSKIPHASP